MNNNPMVNRNSTAVYMPAGYADIVSADGIGVQGALGSADDGSHVSLDIRIDPAAVISRLFSKEKKEA